jgi:hypothetical protein
MAFIMNHSSWQRHMISHHQTFLACCRIFWLGTSTGRLLKITFAQAIRILNLNIQFLTPLNCQLLNQPLQL